MTAKGSVLLALLADRTGQFHHLWHFEPDLFLDYFQQRDIGCPHVADVSYQGASQRAASGIELANTAGDQVHQNVGITNFLQCLFSQFSVQNFFQGIQNESDKVMNYGANAIEKLARFQLAPIGTFS